MNINKLKITGVLKLCTKKCGKMISLITIIAIFLSMFPLQVFATKGPTQSEAENQYSVGTLLTGLSKTATRTSEDTWKIELKFTPTKELVTAPSYEIVLALDTTNSLGPDGLSQLKSAAENVVDQLYTLSHTANVDISLAMLSFGGVTSDTKTIIPLTDLNSKDATWKTNTLNDVSKINMTYQTGTNYEEAFTKANALFADSTKRQIFVFLADGNPNRSNTLGETWDSIQAAIHAKTVATTIKNSGKIIYTIHYNNSDVSAEELLKDCSSGKDYYYKASAYQGLLDVFEKVISKLVIVKFEDYMGPNFKLVNDHSKVTIDPLYGDGTLSEDSIIWAPDKGTKVPTIEHKVTYEVKADPTLKAGNYNNSPTNGVTRFIYSSNNQDQLQQFFTSPLGNFTKASAQVITTGLPASLEGKEPPKLTSDSLIYTGYSGDGKDDMFSFTAPIYNINGVKYEPKLITYHATALGGGIVQHGLTIDNDGSGMHKISNPDLGSGHYTFEIHYDDDKHIVDFETFEGNPIPDNQIVTKGEKAVEPSTPPKKAGNTFDGWYTSDDHGATLSVNKYDFSTPITKDMTLYAKWVELAYKVDFDIMGGDPATKPADQTGLKYGEFIITPKSPTKDKYTFDGWYTSDDHGVTLSVNKYDFSTPITKDMTLYAKWTKRNHLVNFITFGGTPIPVNQIVADGDKATKPATPPEKLDHTFDGWYTSDDYGTTLSATEYDFNKVVTKDMTLYAKWNSSSYTIIYNDGVPGEHVFDDQVHTNVKLGSQTPPFVGTPSRSGYTFDSWAPTVSSTVKGDATYSAQWIKNYDIEIQIEGDGTVSPNGGADNIENVVKGNDLNLAMTPSSGWYIDDVLVDGKSVGKLASYKFGNVQANHVIKVIFKKTPTPVVIPTKPTTNIPQTGDDSKLIVWMIISLVSGLGVLVVCKKDIICKKRTSRNNK